MPDKLPDHYDPTEVERTVQDRWTDPDAFDAEAGPAETSHTDDAEANHTDDAETNHADRAEPNHAYEYVKRTREGDTFYFLDGPPFTSGRMHVGNAWGKVLKDVLLRYHRMQGRQVRARPGYDTHGLPVEVRVEQRHEFPTKQAVEEWGVDRFVAECREYVDEQRAVMTKEFRDLAVWMDWDDPYRTMDADYVDAVWDAFAALYEGGLVERGERVVNTCPRCETAVSDSRLEYADRTVDAAYVGFPLSEREGTLVTWTTTPWTVVANQFVAVDADAEYAAVAVEDVSGPGAATRDGPLYVASECVDDAMDALGVESYAVRERRRGSDLAGWGYEFPLADRLPDHPTPRGEVVHADYVDVERTGLVHSAPGFGHEDFERGRDLGLPPYGPVGLDGRFTDAAGPFAGLAVHGEGRAAVLDALADAGALLATETHTHEYPQCPRCDTDVVLRAAEQWLVRTTDLKPDLLDAAAETEWYPSEARDGRFRNTVESAPDWTVSRQRFWGTPLPVWTCTDCGADAVVDSRADLAARAGLDEVPADPHRPTVDEVTVECPECGGRAERVEDVLDVWFDSAVASWASLGERPGETPGPDDWPADLVVEGNDQTRGWFLMQLVLGVALADRAPYEEVLMHGWALLDGEPMSKSRGHVLRPPEVAAEHGRDALRAHLLSHDQQGQDVSMTSDMQGVETVRDRLDVVWNVARFATLFMAEDGHRPTPGLDGTGAPTATGGRAATDTDGSQSGPDADTRATLDRWVLARLREVVEASTAAFEERAPNEALDATLDFLVEDVSRHYVQAVRDRVWTAGESAGERAVYDVLGTVLHASVRLLAPFVPHLADRLYLALDGRVPTVHAADWPDPDALGLPEDADLLAEVARLREVEAAVATARQRMGRKRRWPVAEVVVETDDPSLAEAVATHRDHLRDRTNADAVSVVADYPEVERVCDPDMAALGPAVGADAEAVAAAVEGRPVDALPRTVTVDGREYEVTREQVTAVERLPESVTAAAFDGGRVYVDGTLTPERRRRGLARDVARRAQQLRAALDLDVDERVRLWVEADDDELRRAVEEHEAMLRERVRIAAFAAHPPDETREWTVDGATLRLGVEPVATAA